MLVEAKRKPVVAPIESVTITLSKDDADNLLSFFRVHNSAIGSTSTACLHYWPTASELRKALDREVNGAS